MSVGKFFVMFVGAMAGVSTAIAIMQFRFAGPRRRWALVATCVFFTLAAISGAFVAYHADSGTTTTDTHGTVTTATTGTTTTTATQRRAVSQTAQDRLRGGPTSAPPPPTPPTIVVADDHGTSMPNLVAAVRNTLTPAQRERYSVAGQFTSECHQEDGLQGMFTCNVTLTLTTRARGEVIDSITLDAVGGGFRKEAAMQQAEKRLIEQIRAHHIGETE